MAKHPHSTDSKVFRRIRGHGRGWVFTATRFRDLGSDTAVGLALMRHAKSGNIRRLARGLYDYPVVHPDLGQLAPDAEKVAQAIAERDHVADLQPIGAQAAN